MGTGVEAREPIAVAFIGPLTGSVSPRGLGGRNAADLAVRQRNAAPGRKARYRLVVLDDACLPDRGVHVVQAAAADGSVVAAVAHYCSIVAKQTAGVFETRGLPAVLWGAHEADITDANDFRQVHRVCGTNRLESEAAARFLVARGYRRWVVIRDTTHYGEDHAHQFAKALARAGGGVVRSVTLAPDAAEIETALDAIAAAAPDVVFVAAAPPPWWSANAARGVTPPHRRPGWMPLSARLRLGLAARDIPVLFQGTSGLVRDPGFLEGAGAAAEATLAFEELVPLSRLPGGLAFQEAYDAAGFVEAAGDFGPHAYAAMTLVLDIIDRVGPDRGRICAALNATAGHASVLGPITFDAKRQNINAPIAPYIVRDGAWMLWEDSDYAAGRRRLPPPRDAAGRS